MWSLSRMGEQRFVQMVQVTWPVWPPCSYMYMVKTLNNLLLWNQKADDLESWYAASGIRVLHLPSLFKWCPGLTLAYFTARSNLDPYAFVWEKCKTMDFSETIVVYDIKVDRCSQLNEYMKLHEYQRSGLFVDLGPNVSDLIFSNFFSSITTRPIEAKFHVAPPWDEGTKAYSNGPGHMIKMATMPIYDKNL